MDSEGLSNQIRNSGKEIPWHEHNQTEQKGEWNAVMLRPNKTYGFYLLMLGAMFLLSALFLAVAEPSGRRTAAASGCVGLIFIVWGSRAFRGKRR